MRDFIIIINLHFLPPAIKQYSIVFIFEVARFKLFEKSDQKKKIISQPLNSKSNFRDG